MLHLFKRVYLAIDETLDINKHRLVYSHDFGHPMGSEFSYEGSLLKFSGSIDDHVGYEKEFNDFLGFLMYLENQQDALDDVIMIYADRSSFVKIGTAYFKALLPLATASDIYRVLISYAMRLGHLAQSPDFEGTVQNMNKLRQKITFTEAEVSSEYFSNRINPHEFTGFFANKREQLSVEFVAATYSYNGQCQAAVSDLLRAFCVKNAYVYFLEARQEIVDTCMTPHTQAVLNLPSVSIEQMSNALKTSMTTKLFFDDRIFPRDNPKVTIDSNWRALTNAEVSKLCRQSIKILKEISLWPDAYSPGNLGLVAVLTAMQDINNPEAWNQKLDYWLDNLPEVAVEGEPHKINAILLYYLRDARRNNRQLLRPFVINGCQ